MQVPLPIVLGAVLLIGTIIFGISAICVIFMREVEPPEVLDEWASN